MAAEYQTYHPITTDEVLYNFDTLQDNSIDNIANVTGFHRNKVREILDLRFNNIKEVFVDKQVGGL